MHPNISKQTPNGYRVCSLNRQPDLSRFVRFVLHRFARLFCQRSPIKTEASAEWDLETNLLKGENIAENK